MRIFFLTIIMISAYIFAGYAGLLIEQKHYALAGINTVTTIFQLILFILVFTQEVLYDRS